MIFVYQSVYPRSEKTSPATKSPDELVASGEKLIFLGLGLLVENPPFVCPINLGECEIKNVLSCMLQQNNVHHANT